MRTSRPRPVLVAGVLGLAVAGGLLGACSSNSTPSASGSTTTTAASASTTTTAAGSGGGSAAALRALTARLQGGEGKTFKAVYTVQSGSGAPQTITFEQSPPKSAIITSSGSVIDTGTQTLYCSTSGATKTCVASSGASPLAALTALFDPKQVLTTLNSLDGMVAAHEAGVSVTNSTRTVGGQSATCVTVSASSSSGGTWCVTDAGLLAYASSASSTITLTSYSASPNPSDFSTPAGATVETLPGGVTIP